MTRKKQSKAQKDLIEKKARCKNDVVKVMKKHYDITTELFNKYSHIIKGIIFVLLVYYLLWLWNNKYPLLDIFFITISLLFFIYIVKIINKERIKENKHTVEILVALIIGVIALQASWPIFMPRISLEDVSQDFGYYNADKEEFRVSSEAILRVKPALYPLPFFIERNYPIARKLGNVIYDNSISYLDITRVDYENIRIKLNRVTGWSFDEVSTKIKYFSSRDLVINILPKNITIYESKNYYDRKFPIAYVSENISIHNPNNFQVKVLNPIVSIYNTTDSWHYLKEWIDDGFCIRSTYSLEPKYYEYYGSVSEVHENSLLITDRVFNTSHLDLVIKGGIDLNPNDKIILSIYFMEFPCNRFGGWSEKTPQLHPYTINGTIKNEESLRYVLIKNINRTKTEIIETRYVSYNSEDRINTYEYGYDLANFPYGYNDSDMFQIQVCENAQNCILSKNITVDISRGYDELNFIQ